MCVKEKLTHAINLGERPWAKDQRENDASSLLPDDARVPSWEQMESPVLGTDGESRLGNNERVPSRERRASPVLGA